MKNNIVLRQLRYIFEWNDAKVIDLFAQAEVEVTKDQVIAWLKKEEHEGYVRISDMDFSSLLNGFINDKRGKREGPQVAPEKILNNNIIFRKLKIALNYKDVDIIDTFKEVDFLISKHEISAFFRNPKQGQYKACEDQFLRNFLHGLQLKFRPKKANEEEE